MNDNMKCLVNRARTLSKLRSNGEEDYEEEWAGIGRMVSAKAFEFGLHAGCYVSTRRLPDLGEVVLRISLVRTTSAYFKQRRTSKQ